MSDELKSSEFFNLCEEPSFREGKSSFDKLRKWLDNKKKYEDLLITAACYKDENNRTPIHALAAARAPSDLVERILKLAPETIKVQDKYGRFPLHWALICNTSSDVIYMLYEAYPKAAEVHNINERLPLHLALQFNASVDVINMLFKAYPQAVEIQDKYGNLPLHYALCRNASNDVVTMLLKAYPQALKATLKVSHTIEEYYSISCWFHCFSQY
jgi:ankyrin repeat protein